MSMHEDLKEEYFFLQQTYEDFDKRALSIKSWCITIALGAIAIGFRDDGFSKELFIFIAAAALLFWLIEAKWKTFQYSNAYRIRILEAHFRGEEKYKELKPFQIYHSWFRAYVEDPPVHEYETAGRGRSPSKRLLQNAMMGVVCVPYVFIVAVGVVGAFVV